MQRRTGYVFEDLYLWHDPGSISYCRRHVEPGEAWENKDTKARFHSLLSVSGALDSLIKVRARNATKDEILRFHTEEYHDRIQRESGIRGGDGGDVAQFGYGSYEIALLSAGGVLSAVESVLSGNIDNAYCLVRPPGHHAVASLGMGFCLFNNIAIGAMHARTIPGAGVKRIAIVDYDVHHGNGTQEAFWNDSETLFISIHQDNNYPQNSGAVSELGGAGAEGTTINIPLPPGSGAGAYKYAFERVVIPALDRFKPDLIMVSSGFDPSYVDPLARMMLSSEDFRWMAKELLHAADRNCGGKIVFCHEGGYSKEYVPFCGLAVVEAISGINTGVVDPSLEEVNGWSYHECQTHQAAVVDTVAALVGIEKTHTGGESATGAGESDTSGLSRPEEGVLRAMQKLLAGISDPARQKAIIRALSSGH